MILRERHSAEPARSTPLTPAGERSDRYFANKVRLLIGNGIPLIYAIESNAKPTVESKLSPVGFFPSFPGILSKIRGAVKF